MLGKLTIGQKIAGIMTAGAIGVLGLSATLNIIETQGLIRGSIDAALKDAEKGFAAKIEDESVRAVTAAALVASNTMVRTAMSQQDRALLQTEWVPRFAELKDQFAVRQMQFHTPESKSFLRVHRPDRFGDDLTAIRPGVVAANAQRKAVSGLEMGREGLGLRGIAPITHEGRHVGTVEFGLSFDETLFKDFQQQSGVKVALYIDQDGKLELFAGSAPDFKELATDFLAQGARERVLIERMELGGVAHAAVAHPVLDFAGRPIGVGVKAIDRTAFDAALARTWQVAGGLAAIVAFFAAGIVWIMNRHIGRPLSTMTGVMQAMAGGALDTALDCGGRQDEIGKMACVLEEFRAALKRTREMEREQAALQARMEAGRRTALLEVADGFESSVRGVVQSLEVSVGTMQAASTQMSAAAGQTKAQSEAVSRSSEETNSNVQTVAAAAEEMSVSIQEIARQAVAARDATTQAVTSVRDADATVSRLEQAAASINEIVAAISDIANKTNLLALNATIEAARAGEAGKGFAVVASEVKALAMQTKRATEEIGGKIGMMRDATNETSRAVGSVKGVIQSVDGIASAIAAAAEQQSAATNEIVRSVQSAAQGIQTVTENISGVRACANDSSRTAEEVHGTATGLADSAATLSQRVEEFLKQLRAA